MQVIASSIAYRNSKAVPKKQQPTPASNPAMVEFTEGEKTEDFYNNASGGGIQGKGMSKGLKIGLLIGVVVSAAAIIYHIVKNKK